MLTLPRSRFLVRNHSWRQHCRNSLLLPRYFRVNKRSPCSTSKTSFHSSAFRFQESSNVFHSQLEDASAAAVLSSLKTWPKIPQTFTEKIVQRYSVGLPEGKFVQSGDFVFLSPHKIMSHDNSWPIAMKFMSIGASKIYDPKQLVMTLDHDIQNRSENNLKKYRQIEQFAKKHGVDFYGAGRGIGHQIMVEEGYAWPGTLVVASDSHSTMYGGIGCLGTAVVRTDAASVWAAGTTWWQCPKIANVVLTGTLPKGVTGKDVIIALAGCFSQDEVLNHAIEFTGSEETMRSLPIDDRLTIANMACEWGALTGLFPIDSVLQNWLRYKATEAAMFKNQELPEDDRRFTHPRIDALFGTKLEADKGAKYAKQLYLNLSTVAPYVSGPNSVKVARSLAEISAEEIKIQKAYLVSCTNSRASDLAAAAKVFKDAAENNGGKIPKIAQGVNFYIAAASQLEQEAAEAAGDWQAMVEAGAQPLPAGCGPCIGLGTGLLEPGENGISASNRNFKGRMGSTEAKAYLASPEVVAASALSGKISGPGRYEQPPDWNGVEFGEGDGIKEEDRMITADQALEKIIGQLDSLVATGEHEFGAQAEQEEQQDDSKLTSVLPGFPEEISGEIIFCDSDNLSTDGIYPGKLTYEDDVSQEQMAEACMRNYDPAFSSIAKEGDILVSAYNFGCGSSREQAATAILAKKIPLVISGSFGNIFARNSINNALVGLEIPRLVGRLRESFSVPSTRQESDIEEPDLNKESLDSPPPAPLKETPRTLTRRTGWRLTWDVKRSKVVIDEGSGKQTWSVKVGELPANVQEIIAAGGLEKWVKNKIES